MSAVFPDPTPAAWRAEAEKALKGRGLETLLRLDADQLAVRPLYGRASGTEPISAPRARDAEGRAWDVRVGVEADDGAEANAQLLAALQGGAASVVLSGAVLDDSETLARALDAVSLEIAPAALDAGLKGDAAANALAVAAKGSPRAQLLFHMDPLSAFAEAGAAPRSVDEHIALAANTAARHAGAYPQARFFLAGGRVAHEAGGSLGQMLGFTAASANLYIEASVAAGLSVAQALDGVVLGLSVDQRHFDGLCAVRAMRLIWRSLSQAWGQETPATIEARSSRRMLAARDPWPNLLRLGAAGFAGAVGGAEAVIVEPFTQALGRPDAFARRQALSAQLVLMEEAHLGRVADPAAGSWFLDSRTRELADAGWAELQRIEREGGLIASLRAGAFQTRVAEARRAADRALSEGHDHLVGVTRYVDEAPRPAQAAPRPALASEGGGDACPPLTPVRWAAAFEEASA
ncbi:methylmalonyl-CoA mutase [Brevundimonas sp. Leaf363]|uniref:methylmalonyl-CoA mutase family protein n=1 Tax=Brevundimonas sp. Leaf363 TaxID=1736353 RepID=UPI0006FBCA19|nr:methylmalonyl-CoA mutase family protein [Brevundimonas sp. Leaf363]KQS53659.1 methylmalonyl-CoA mutase [Brevundimonas sp. Leaf363]